MSEFDPIDVWPAIVRAYQEVRGEAEIALHQNGVSSLEEYDILLELRRATTPLTLSEIEARTLLRQYQLSRMVDRLEKKGMAERSVSEADGRARVVTLTAKGRKTQKMAGRAYFDVLMRRFADRLDPAEAKQARRLLDRIVED